MQSALSLLVLSLLPVSLAAQRPKFQLDVSTPEGSLLVRAAQETDAAKQTAMFEDYLAKYPKHAALSWACAQLAPLYVKAGEFDKAMKTAETGLAADPLNSPLAYNGLQGAEGKKDPALIKTWSGITVDAAKKVLEEKKPEDADEVEDWTRQTDFARQVIDRADYSLYVAALQATDPKVAVDMGDTLEKRNPQSAYMHQIAPPYMRGLIQTGQGAAAAAVAGRVLAAGKANEEVLLLGADAALSSQTFDKAIEFSGALIKAVSAAAPQGTDAAAWEKRKTAILGRAHWTAGIAHGALEHWVESDQSMRTALPLVADQPDMLPAVYFYIGVANFRMALGPKTDKVKLAEARKYMQMCAAIKSPFQETAQKNLAAMGRIR